MNFPCYPVREPIILLHSLPGKFYDYFNCDWILFKRESNFRCIDEDDVSFHLVYDIGEE